MNTLKALFEHYLTWFKAHEKFLIIVLGAWLAFHFYGRGLEAWIEHDKRLATIAAQKVTVDETSNKALAGELELLKLQIQSQTAALQQEILQRSQQTQKQKEVDKHLGPSELSQRIVELLNAQKAGLGPVDVAASTVNDSLVFSNLASHAVAGSLEDLQQAQGDVVDLNTQLTGCRNVTAKQDVVITGLNQQIVDEKVSHKKDVDLAHAETKRAWLRGFKWGFAAGATAVEAVRIFVFHKP